MASPCVAAVGAVRRAPFAPKGVRGERAKLPSKAFSQICNASANERRASLNAALENGRKSSLSTAFHTGESLRQLLRLPRAPMKLAREYKSDLLRDKLLVAEASSSSVSATATEKSNLDLGFSWRNSVKMCGAFMSLAFALTTLLPLGTWARWIQVILGAILLGVGVGLFATLRTQEMRRVLRDDSEDSPISFGTPDPAENSNSFLSAPLTWLGAIRGWLSSVFQSDLKSDLAMAKSELSWKDEQLNAAVKSHRKMEHALNKAKTEAMTLKTSLTKVQDELAHAEESGTSSSTLLRTTKQQLGDVRNENASLKAALENLKKELESTTGKMAGKELEEVFIAQKLEATLRDLEAVRAQNKSLQEQLASLDAELSLRTSRLDFAEGQLTTACDKLDTAEQQLASVLADKAELSASLEEERMRSETLQMVGEALEKENDVLESDLKHLREWFEKLEVYNRDLLAQLRVMQDSQVAALAAESKRALSVAFPEKDLDGLCRYELTKLIAYLNYKQAGRVGVSSVHDQLVDWKDAQRQVNEMEYNGHTENDFLAEFYRVSSILIQEGDWSQFVPGPVGAKDIADSDIRRTMLSVVLQYFASTLELPKSVTTDTNATPVNTD